MSNKIPAMKSTEEDTVHEIPLFDRRFSAIYCSFFWPMHPGHSGGEIRDFHVLKKLLSNCETFFISVANHQEKGRRDYLRSYLKGYFDPRTLVTSRQEMVHQSVLKLPLMSKILAWMRRHDLPVLGARYHADIARFSHQVNAYALPIVRELLEKESADFLIVSPQLNPLVLNLGTIDALPSDTRLILSSYDVESERIISIKQSMRGLSRIAWELETKRAEAFARDNLKLFDGVIAVSELDKSIYVNKYGIEPERVLVVENGVDTSYFAFRNRMAIDIPNVVFIGNLVYQPNDQAAQRLLKSIMPIVRKTLPDVKAYVVGAAPRSELLTLVDGDRNIVTGRVPDVRPYLNEASVVCVPLLAGSGTKYKVLEAMSVGTPIVCTSLAIKGFDDTFGQYVRLGESDREIAEALIDVLKHPEACYETVLRARDHVERLYSWDRNLEGLSDWLNRIKSLLKR